MKNIKAIRFFLLFFLILMGGNSFPLKADDVVLNDSLIERVEKNPVKGTAVVRWGAATRWRDGRANLFSYEVQMDNGGRIVLCTELMLYPGQSVFVAVRNSNENEGRWCSKGAHYLAIDSMEEFIFKGYYDLVKNDVWLELSSMYGAEIGCPGLKVFSALVDYREMGTRVVADLHGVAGRGSYFSAKGMMKCLSARSGT